MGNCHIVKRVERQTPTAQLAPNFHVLWREIHTNPDATQEWWDGIVKKVSSYFCSCGDFLKTYVTTNPPRFDDWFRWTWELHNAVNHKLNKPNITLDEAKAIWLTDKQS